MELLIAFVAGLLVATIIWYFVLRNNRNKIQLWLDTPEAYFTNIQNEVGDLGQDLQTKINEIVAEIKRRKQ